MALFRDDKIIEIVEYGCPICHSDVKGNDVYLYFCQKCSILFKRDDLVLDRKVVEDIAVKKIVDKFDRDKDRLKIEDRKIKEKGLTEKKQAILKDLRESKKYYISKKSNILHMSNCPYGKNIKKENKIILRNLEGTEKLKKCRCMTEYL
jgi:hypothetical protein